MSKARIQATSKERSALKTLNQRKIKENEDHSLTSMIDNLHCQAPATHVKSHEGNCKMHFSFPDEIYVRYGRVKWSYPCLESSPSNTQVKLYKISAKHLPHFHHNVINVIFGIFVKKDITLLSSNPSL